jgi:CheY-like chemotaxis protein
MTEKLILLIDPEDSVREVLKLCLCYLGGWNVLSAGSFQDGLEALSIEQPDAIVLGVSPSEIDDWAFIQYLKNNPLTCAIPILLLCTRASWFSSQQLQDMGVVGAIAKPFNSSTLAIQIAELLNWSLGHQFGESYEKVLEK